MPIVIKHPFVSPLADSGSSTEVEPSDWNAAHGIEMSTNFVIGRGSAGTGPAEEIPCNSDGRSILNILSLAHGDVIFRGASGFQRLAAGVAGQKLETQGVGANPIWASGGGLVLGTAVNTTSGTAIDITGILAGTNLIILMFSGVSTNGTAEVIVQLGDAGGVETTGYSTSYGFLAGTSGFISYSDAFNIGGTAAADTRSGTLIFSRLTGNTWNCIGVISLPTAVSFVSGTKTLSDTLDRIRITTRGGANTFDAGQANIGAI